MRRDASTDLCMPVVSIKDEMRVWLGSISAVRLERGWKVGGGSIVVREEPADGLDIGFLVELGWASLIIAMGRTGQFALLLFSRKCLNSFFSVAQLCTLSIWGLQQLSAPNHTTRAHF